MDYKIKFNAIRDLADARFAASVMAEWMGFTLGAENDLNIQQIQEICNWCSGPKITLELDPQLDLEKVITYCNVLKVEAIECNAFQKLDLSKRLQNIEYIGIDSDEGLSHSRESKSENKIYPLKEFNAAFLEENGIEQFSLDCFDPEPNQEAGEKDFTKFYDFFEELGLL